MEEQDVVDCRDSSVPVAIQQPKTILGPPLLRKVLPAVGQISSQDDFDEFDGDEIPGAETPPAGQGKPESGGGGLVDTGRPPCETVPAFMQSHCR